MKISLHRSIIRALSSAVLFYTALNISYAGTCVGGGGYGGMSTGETCTVSGGHTGSNGSVTYEYNGTIKQGANECYCQRTTKVQHPSVNIPVTPTGGCTGGGGYGGMSPGDKCCKHGGLMVKGSLVCLPANKGTIVQTSTGCECSS